MNKRINSLKELLSVKEKNNSSNTYKKRLLICAGGGCVASGSLKVSEALKNTIKERSLEKEYHVVEVGCLGLCAKGPVMLIEPERVFYQNIQPEDAVDIVEKHLIKGEIVERLCSQDSATGKAIPKIDDIRFFKGQIKIALRNCGSIDPLDIEEYIGRDGYFGLAKALLEMKPAEIIDSVKRSGLKGRGGGGFPAGIKWELTSKSVDDVKYVLCNADEGDPGAFMDRSVLEGDPHSVIEAMCIAGRAIGSSQGYIYVRAEYPLAVERFTKALEQAKQYGLLGKNILGTDFNFELEIRMGSGAFVCGEETALITSIEGNRGEPRPRPPFPAVKGLWDKPSLLNNVETYANIPIIILKGPDWYASYGTEKSKGTKVFALAGAINNTGLVEVPIGQTLRDIIFEVGGGLPNNKKFKAAQIGGPSGGCVPDKHADVKIDYQELIELGAMMGSGGLIIMDEDSCMVDVARYFLDFVQDESCGKCTPCSIGTKRMLEILERICDGKGEDGDIERLIDLGSTIRDTALCALGQSAPNPALSTIRHFRSEYEAHIYDKKCPSTVCKSLFKINIKTDKCTGCTLCSKRCPTSAITGEKKTPHVINQDKCIKCRICVQVCKIGAIEVL